MTDFHDTRFPLDIAFGSSGGPQRSTQIITLGSGYEQRNQRWENSRRRFDAGYGVKSLDNLQQVVAFFEARRGPLYGFRFRDPADHKSCLPSLQPTALDQLVATGDGAETSFQLIKRYGSDGQEYSRPISHPVEETLQISVGEIAQTSGTDYAFETGSGLVTFFSPPAHGAAITAGYEFDVPVRFDADQLVVNLAAFTAGEIPSIPLIEVRT
jgi:uncharacterized protein (TIGR02217 family)